MSNRSYRVGDTQVVYKQRVREDFETETYTVYGFHGYTTMLHSSPDLKANHTIIPHHWTYI